MAKAEKSSPDSTLQRMEDRIDATLLGARRIFISDGVDAALANEVIRKLWFLEITDPGKPILLVINSPGGSVDAGMAIWDQIQMISSPVSTLVCGIAASMGSVLSLAAPKGRRFATPNARIMIHQPSLHGVLRGQATDLEIQAREMLKTRKLLINLYMQATGKDFETLNKAIDRDNWMSAEEAKAYGLLDKIVESFETMPANV